VADANATSIANAMPDADADAIPEFIGYNLFYTPYTFY
jgi:hypothetical protein